MKDGFFSESAWIKLLKQIGMMCKLHTYISKINGASNYDNNLMWGRSVLECKPINNNVMKDMVVVKGTVFIGSPRNLE